MRLGLVPSLSICRRSLGWRVGCRLLALLAPGKELFHVDLILATSHVETSIEKGSKTSGETPLLILIDAQLPHGPWPLVRLGTFSPSAQRCTAYM